MKCDALWQQLVSQAQQDIRQEPLLAGLYHGQIINHPNLGSALSTLLANRLNDTYIPALELRDVFAEVFAPGSNAARASCQDMLAYLERDPAITGLPQVLLYLKGFMALQGYRAAHWLWQHNRHSLAVYLQSRISETFDVDIHPAARVGCGVMLDHASGIVIGETSVVEDNVSILQGVTLGGTGKECGDRHPKIRAGVLIGAGAKILGNIVIGEGAKVGAGSVVLKAVAPHTTVAGVPAKQIGCPESRMPALDMCQNLANELANPTIVAPAVSLAAANEPPQIALDDSAVAAATSDPHQR